MSLSGIGHADWVAITGTIAGIIGVVLTIVTLRRVGRVQAAQAAARKTTEELLSIDELEVDLLRVIAKLHESADRDSARLAGELGVKLGIIRGVRRTFKSGTPSPLSYSVDVGRGFFSQDFVHRNVGDSRQCVDIVTGRTKLASGFYILDAIRKACERGVQVRIIGLSPDASAEILEDARKTVSNPAPRDAADYKRQICENRDEILTGVASWPDHAKENFTYVVSASVPRISVLRCDSWVRFGFLQLYTDAQSGDLESREYVSFPLASDTARAIVEHIDLLEKEGTVIYPSSAPEPVAGSS